jgi:hypothetical protein
VYRADAVNVGVDRMVGFRANSVGSYDMTSAQMHNYLTG